MAFRKRNVPVGNSGNAKAGDGAPIHREQPGVRPSTLTSHTVTSTGTPSLDDVLGGHSGLPLGSTLLIEESGTTDFAGALLRFYAAEGVCQGHVIHVVGLGDGWIRELPGIADEQLTRRQSPLADEERMKIAWRYEGLGAAGERALPDRALVSPASGAAVYQPFCHTFDLTKRLIIPHEAKINHIRIAPSSKPFESVLQDLDQKMKASAPGSTHRILLPTILSPALWPPQASMPENFLHFLHTLRSLLRQYRNSLTAMITLPLELHPRGSGLVRWAELLSDGVIELIPFPHSMDGSASVTESDVSRGTDEKPQGILQVHKLPITTERGEGGAGTGNSIGEDLSFIVSRRKFSINKFSLPPLEGNQEAQKDAGKLTSKDVEF